MQKFNFSLVQLLYFLLAFCLGMGIKYFYSVATHEQLIFILFPVHTLVELQTSSQGIFVPEKGYVFSDLHICIDKSCAGLNFWAICFLACAFVLIKKIKEQKYTLFLLFILLIITFFATIFTNTSRIIIALLSLRSFPALAKQTWFHEAQGAFVFVSTLFICYLSVSYIIDFFQDKKRN